MKPAVLAGACRAGLRVLLTVVAIVTSAGLLAGVVSCVEGYGRAQRVRGFRDRGGARLALVRRTGLATDAREPDRACCRGLQGGERMGAADRVLVISLQGIGNLIMATPVIEGLARAGREVHVVAAARPFAEFIGASQWVSAATSLEGARRGAARAGLSLRRGRFEASVSTYPNGRRAALLALAAGARERVGFADGVPPWMGRAYTTRLSVTTGLHDVEQNQRLLDALGVPRPPAVAPHVPVTDGDRAFAERFLAEAHLDAGRPVAAVHPGGATTGLFRRWPRERFEELAVRLRRDLGLGAVLVGDASERSMLEGIARGVGGGAVVVAGPPLGHVAAVIATCRVFVGNDSGLLHVAAALGIPTVGIYGPTNEVRTAPYGPGHTVLTAPVGCRPCYAFGERFSCVFDQLVCLHLIDVDVVLAAVKAKLAGAVG